MQSFFLSFNNRDFILYLLLILIGLIYLTIKLYGKLQQINFNEKKVLIFIRTLIWIIIIVVLMEPVFNLTVSKTDKNNLFVLIDNSASMNIKDKNNTARIDKSENILQINSLKKLKKKLSFHYFKFNSGISEILNDSELKNLTASGTSTEIENAFYYIMNSDNVKNSYILLLSDGVSTSYFDVYKIINMLKKLNIKVFAVNLFSNEILKDISLTDIYYPDEVSINSKFNIELKINAVNYNAIRTKVQLWVNDKLKKHIPVILHNGITKINIPVVLKKKGINKIRFKIKKAAGESVFVNNEQTVFIRAVKDKLKVLLVYGKPCWEYKFLKNCLESDAGINITSFLKLKNSSLIKLNNISLKNFDLFIIGNIKYRDLPAGFVNRLIERIKLYGTSVLFTGGENSFKNGDYHISKFKDIIPVNWDKAGEIFESEFTLKPTPEGMLSDFLNSSIQWNAMPPFDKINIIKSVKKNARVLAVSSVRPDFVVLAVSKYKLSQIAVFTAYPTWQWAFLNLGINRDTSDYNFFWRRLVRDLVSNRFSGFNIFTDKLTYKKDENIKINLISDNNYFNSDNIKVKLFRRKNKEYVFVKNIVLSKNSITDNLYETEISLGNYGDYKISALVNKKYAETFFVVKQPFKEWNHIVPDKNLLKTLCASTKGKYFESIKDFNIKKYIDFRNKKKKYTISTDLWNNWFILLILVGLLSAEWWYRKKKGLL